MGANINNPKFGRTNNFPRQYLNLVLQMIRFKLKLINHLNSFTWLKKEFV